MSKDESELGAVGGAPPSDENDDTDVDVEGVDDTDGEDTDSDSDEGPATPGTVKTIDISELLEEIPDRRPDLTIYPDINVLVPNTQRYKPCVVREWELAGTVQGRVGKRNVRISCAVPFRYWPRIRKDQTMGKKTTKWFKQVRFYEGMLEWLDGPPRNENLVITLMPDERPTMTASDGGLHRHDLYPANPLERRGGRLQRFPTHPRLPQAVSQATSELDGVHIPFHG